MLHSLGTDGTLKSTTLEGRLRELVALLQQIEKDTQGINSKNADCILQGTGNPETEEFVASCQCYVDISDMNSLTYPDPYNAAGYVAGTGSEATNFNAALAEVAFAVYKAEGNSTNNPNQLARKLAPPTLALLENRLTQPIPHNAILSFSFTIPTVTTTVNGITSTVAKEFLSNG